MKFLQLQYFKAACKYNNITKAAEELHVSQPSISMAIKELETEFGVALFNRLNKGFALTKEGQILLEKADDLLEHAENVTQVMTDLGKKRNLIRLGIPPMIGTFLFPKIYKGFKEQYPNTQLITQEFGTKHLLESLRNDAIDIAIVPSNDITTEIFHILNITQTETVFCVSKNHRLASKKIIDITDIIDEPIIMFNDGSYQNEIINARFSQHQAKPNVIYSSNQIYSIKEFITNEIASGFMHREIAEMIPDIVSIPLDNPIIIQISLIWKKKQHIFSDMILFINYMKQLKSKTNI